MEPEILKYLYDIRDATSAILKFVQDKTYDDYREDDLLKSGVERKFEIIGEALNRNKTKQSTNTRQNTRSSQYHLIQKYSRA